MVRMRPIRSARVAAKSDDTPATRLQLETWDTHKARETDRDRQKVSLSFTSSQYHQGTSPISILSY